LVLGEVGLTGEVRGIGQVETRIQEAQKMGFTRCLVPQSNRTRLSGTGGMTITGIRTISEGIENLF
jgi:DNA repair protein RadA/Sms